VSLSIDEKHLLSDLYITAIEQGRDIGFAFSKNLIDLHPQYKRISKIDTESHYRSIKTRNGSEFDRVCAGYLR